MATNDNDLADVSRRRLELILAKRQAHGEFERVKRQAEQAIIDEVGGDVKKLGPNAEAQERKLALLLEQSQAYQVALKARDAIDEALLRIDLDYDLLLEARHERDYALRLRLVGVLEAVYSLRAPEIQEPTEAIDGAAVRTIEEGLLNGEAEQAVEDAPEPDETDPFGPGEAPPSDEPF